MLTIGQLAAYAGVTVRAVRHYHQIGLLAEPRRDASGYRTYDAADVVRLVRIRTLAEAGVPLSRVQDLMEADEEAFVAAVSEIDQRLREEIRALQEHRRRIARLAAGDSLALPAHAVDYLERLRACGVSEAMVEGERDAWILIAARWPEKMAGFIAEKNQQLDDPRTVQLYRLIGELLEAHPRNVMDETRLAAMADLIVELAEESAGRGDFDRQHEDMADDTFVALLDSFASEAHPLVERLQDLLAERGWTGWIRMQRAEGSAAQ